MLTLPLLQSIFSAAPATQLAPYVDPLNTVCEQYEINTPLRLAAFLAQVGHESGYFKFVAENLNYSQPSLRAVFPKYFPTDALAADYARKPEKIANRVYASRMGNGDEASGDGFKFKGRGLIQITGKNNYTAFAAIKNIPLDEAVTYLQSTTGAVESAAWYWDSNKLNPLADGGDMIAITKKINGGTNGLEERQKLYAKAKAALNC